MAEWQTIDTAPKDGKQLLLLEDGVIYIGKYVKKVHWNYPPVTEEEYAWVADRGFFFHPTHWMPLPEVPKEKHFCKTLRMECEEQENGAFRLSVFCWEKGLIIDKWPVFWCPICGEKADW